MIYWNPEKRILSTEKREARLSLEENKVILILYTWGKNRLVPHDLMLEAIYGSGEDRIRRQESIASRISNIRRKLGIYFIQSRKQVGYILSEDITLIG